MAFLVSRKIELFCLFAIQDEVTGEKSSNLRREIIRDGKLFETETASKIWQVNKFCIILTTLGFP